MEEKVAKAIQDSMPTGTYIEEIARDLRIHRATVKNYVLTLVAKGLVRADKRGTEKWLYWEGDGSG